MILPELLVGLVALVGVVGVVWWWVSRFRVSPAPIAMKTTRIPFPGGLRPHEPHEAMLRLHEPDEIVIPHDRATLVIDYPLSTPASVEITSPIEYGFTRAELVKAICEEYANIYEAEEGSAHTKTVPLEERGAMRGRNRTDGAYGIWGHDLEDLIVTAARWTRRSNGSVLVELHVETSPQLGGGPKLDVLPSGE
jgi:hypothetical protein